MPAPFAPSAGSDRFSQPLRAPSVRKTGSVDQSGGNATFMVGATDAAQGVIALVAAAALFAVARHRFSRSSEPGAPADPGLD